MLKPLEFKGSYINGKFTGLDNPDEEWDVKSPSDLSDQVLTVAARNDHVEEACDVAQRAFKDWRKTSLEERKNQLLKLQNIYREHSEELARVIARETGKPFWEAKTEAAAMANKISITIEHSLRLVEETKIEGALPKVDGYIRFKPRGVMAVLGPFNFPGHLPNGHIIPALLMGNTIVFKPSDKTPAVGQFMAELFHKAEFPKGVFNLVQGKSETGRRLVVNEHVDGILFTGSYDVGLKIKQETIRHYWKLLALEMGGKNTAIVWKDADLKKAIYENIVGAFVTAGQRCSCTSKIVLHKSIKDQFLDTFYETAKKLKIGHWQEDNFMGSLISEDSVENYIRFQEIAKREGNESLMRGKALELDYQGHYVTPSITLVKEFDPKSVYQNHEIFGPNVGVYEVDDFEEALAITNSSGFGLVASVFSKDRALYEKALLEAKVGLVNWNRTTNGASSKMPFGGMGKSGNDRPSGDFAIQYCSVPVASLEDTTEFNPASVMPGVDYQYTDK